MVVCLFVQYYRNHRIIPSYRVNLVNKPLSLTCKVTQSVYMVMCTTISRLLASLHYHKPLVQPTGCHIVIHMIGCSYMLCYVSASTHAGIAMHH